jgi:hypothetical protein
MNKNDEPKELKPPVALVDRETGDVYIISTTGAQHLQQERKEISDEQN